MRRGARAPDAQRRASAARLGRVRAVTHRLVEAVEPDDLHRQFDPIMSPLVWDIGHVANFEELWLLRTLDGRPRHDARLDRVYDPFEQPRGARGDLELLSRAEAMEYMARVRAEALRVLDTRELGSDAPPLVRAGSVYSMVAQHEAQHQETMLQALDLGRDLPPYPPVLDRWCPAGRPIDDTERALVPAGPFEMGTDDRSVAYDNERPAHLVDVEAFAIDRFPATARRYAEFVAEGGYARPELWSGEGWAWRRETGHEVPQGWLPDPDGGWRIRRFGRVWPLDPREIVQHLSFWEAEAFCRFAGGRLPTEPEWEKAARWDPAAKRSRANPWGDEPPSPAHANLDRRAWSPSRAGSFPAGGSAYGVEHLVGDVHEWTASDFVGYPGYVSFPYEEYSEVFFGADHKVLRGSSWATAPLVARATVRNWDHPQRRQIFSGVRVAHDVVQRGATRGGGSD